MTAGRRRGRETAGGPAPQRLGKVLLLEDEQDVAELIRYNLVKEGYDVLVSGNGAEALRLAREHRPDVILLDIMVPQLNGWEVCRRLKQDADLASIPVIMVSGRVDEGDKVLGFELGADDYVTKPFSVREVLARVNAVIRRSRAEAAERAIPERDEIGNFAIDRPARRVLVDGHDVKLTAREFELLSYLVAHSGRVQSRDVILQHVWGVDFMGDRKTVDVHVRWLREKFGGRVSFEIVTVRGAGYRLDRLVDSSPPAGADRTATA